MKLSKLKFFAPVQLHGRFRDTASDPEYIITLDPTTTLVKIEKEGMETTYTTLANCQCFQELPVEEKRDESNKQRKAPTRRASKKKKEDKA